MSAIDDIVPACIAQVYKKPGQRKKAEAVWTELRGQFADDRKAIRELAKKLRRGGQAPLVSELFDRLVAALPQEAWLLNAAAAHAADIGAHRVALRLAQTAMRLFPAVHDGFCVAVAALIKLDRGAEAETLLAESQTQFGITDWQLLAKITLGQKRRDWPGVLATAEQLRDLMPKKPDGLTYLAVALSRLSRGDEAERVVGDAVARFPKKPAVLKAAASVAEARRDYELALDRWAAYRAQYPKSKAGYIYALQILQKTRRFDLAGSILEEAEAKFPRDRKILQVLAAIASREGRWQEADMHWQKLVSLYPDKAEYALSAALTPIGHRLGRRKRMPEVLDRLKALHDRFPAFEPGYVAHLGVLRDERMLEEAAELGQAWCALFPDNIALALARASAAEDAGAFADSLAQIETLRARIEGNPVIEVAYVHALSTIGRDADAEAACRAAIEAHPKEKELLAEYARLASRNGDWTEALARWRDAQTRLPGDKQIAREISLVAVELAGQADADAFAGTPAAENLFARFESLGGTATGCEFGMVQRKFGSEGIGLLRWTKSSIEHLTAALEQDFAGVGEEEHTVLSTARFSAEREEYVTSDTRFEMESHTFMTTSAAPADKMFVQTCRRLRFLRGKLIEDLRAADKIFVFKIQDPESDEAIRRLYAAMRRYGDVTLLCVLAADEDNARGSIRVLEPGLLVGYIGYFIKAGDGGSRGIDFVTWKILVEEAERVCAIPVHAPAQAA